MKTLLLSMTTCKAWIPYLVGTSFCLLVYSSCTFVLVHICASHVSVWKMWKRPAGNRLRTISVYSPQWNLWQSTPQMPVLSSWLWCCICRDCETYFGRESLQPITRDDSVVCETQYSKVVPLEGGEVSGQILVIEINTELWVLRLSQSCNWGLWSSGVWYCITEKVVPVTFKMSEVLTHWCSITYQKKRILKCRILTCWPY